MKIKFVAVPVMLAALASAACFPASADNETACGAVMCLFGAASGHGGGSQCDQYINPYYSIVRFDWKGFDPSATFDARKQFLQQCSSANSDTISVANSNGGSQFAPGTATPPTKPGRPPVCGRVTIGSRQCVMQ